MKFTLDGVVYDAVHDGDLLVISDASGERGKVFVGELSVIESVVVVPDSEAWYSGIGPEPAVSVEPLEAL